MKQLLFCLLLFMLCFPVAAKHILGGTISYKNLGVNAGNVTYQLRIHLFRDCTIGNANFDDPILGVCIYQARNGNLFDVIDMPMLGNPQTLPTSPYIPCIQQALYSTTLTLPTSNEGYTIMFKRCCRNVVISNLVSPDIEGLSLYIKIPPSNIINSSAELSNLYPFFGTCSQFQHTIMASDLENDNIVFELTTPYSGGSADDPIPTCTSFFSLPYQITLNTGFSLQNILKSTTPLTINAQGQLNAAGIPLGSYAFGLDTKEFRNGQLISTTHSEFSIDILKGYVALEDEVYQIGFYISPNPADANIQLSLPQEELKSFEIFSMEGKSLLIGTENLINVVSFPRGIYLIKVETEKGIGKRFFVKE